MSNDGIPYDDGFRSRRIDDAIRRGWVIKHVDKDGIVRYEITFKCLREYWLVNLQQKMQRDFEIFFGVHF